MYPDVFRNLSLGLRFCNFLDGLITERAPAQGTQILAPQLQVVHHLPNLL